MPNFEHHSGGPRVASPGRAAPSGHSTWRWGLGVLMAVAVLQHPVRFAGAQGLASEAGAGGAELQVRKEASLTPAEMTSAGREVQSRGTELSVRFQRLLDVARQKNDIMLATCFDDKATRTNTALEAVKARFKRLLEAVNRIGTSRAPAARDGAMEDAENNYTFLRILGDRLEQVSADGDQCTGEGIFEVGQAVVETVVDQAVIGVDTLNPYWSPLGTPGSELVSEQDGSQAAANGAGPEPTAPLPPSPPTCLSYPCDP